MRVYIRPEVNRVELDNSISLVMMTWSPGDGKPPSPPGRPPDKPWPPNSSPFDSPFHSPFK